MEAILRELIDDGIEVNAASLMFSERREIAKQARLRGKA